MHLYKSPPSPYANLIPPRLLINLLLTRSFSTSFVVQLINQAILTSFARYQNEWGDDEEARGLGVQVVPVRELLPAGLVPAMRRAEGWSTARAGGLQQH